MLGHMGGHVVLGSVAIAQVGGDMVVGVIEAVIVEVVSWGSNGR